MNPSSSNARLRPFRPVPFGRYTLLTQLATGGMGEIFLARLEGMQGFEKLCVIKKILPQLAADPEFVERFVGEARTLVKLSHGSIAQVLDMGLQEGEAFMALEYVDGKDLRKVAARARDKQRTLPLSFVLFVMGRVLDALAYAHRKKGDDEGELNLVHRDISPQNILISYEGEVKVIDFGLAKSRLSAAKTNPSIILGKFLYMSPEQARHLPVDRRSDLYAVGLCLYEMLSGQNPFDLLPPGEMMSAVAHPNIAPLAQVAPGVPAAVSDLVMKALAVDPTQRFQNAEELRGRLNACLLAHDADSGPEDIGRFMHELFASEYMAERRLLVMLREVGRAPEPEPEVIGMPEGVPPRPMASLPPKTIRLDGPVEALSFKPTPRTREGGVAGNDQETRPGVMVDEPTRPGVMMDEPTRPAVALESLDETRREPPPPPPPAPAHGPGPAPTSHPTLEAPRVVPQALLDEEEPDAPPPIENTPNWAVPLPPEEDPRYAEAESESESESEEEELGEPIVGTLDLSESDVLEDTRPRAQMPRPPSGKVRAVPSSDVYHQDTQPRVVLDASLMREGEQDDVPAAQRPRSGSTKIPRRRVTATGLPAVAPRAPAAPPRLVASPPAAVDDDATSEDANKSLTPPSVPAARVPAPPRRSRVGLWVGVAVLGFGTGVGAWWLWRQGMFAPAGPPPSAPPAVIARAPEPAELEPAEPPSELAAAPGLDAPDASTAGAPEPRPIPSASAIAAAAAADAGVVADAGSLAAAPAPLEEDDMLAPLAAAPRAQAPASAAPKSVRKPPRSNKQGTLQKEWARTRGLYLKLTQDAGCENFGMLCTRYRSLESEVQQAADSEDEDLVREVRALQRDLSNKRNGS
ncbi:protein kinase domain-containing protein [Melittangium boletus]|uniref:serine/threonine protein kinase n=1 Tax=Melittangium boletus TaxID=83453 RepID=UPI003DA22899